MTLQELTAAFAHEYADRPIPAAGPIDTSPIDATPDTDELDAIWQQVIPETRARGNDFHLPLSVACARRLCDAYPQADRELVLVATLLHDTGWAHVDEGRIISEEFIAKVTAIIDGHDTRQEAHSIEDALMRDADRAWRFDRVGIALASGWFGQTPDYYTDRLEHEIIRNLSPKRPSPWPMLT